LIAYNLWVHSGLSYQQRLENKESRDEILKKYKEACGSHDEFLIQNLEYVHKNNEDKLKEEERRMKLLKNEIKATVLSKSLDTKEKEKIENLLKNRDNKAVFEGKKVRNLSWQDLSNIMGFQHGGFNNLNSYFSLYTHPSNVSVFQFDQIFQDGKSYLDLVDFNLSLVNKMVTAFLKEYLSIYSDSMIVYENLPTREKILIDIHNVVFRGDEMAME
jgi:hypothetical protein